MELRPCLPGAGPDVDREAAPSAKTAADLPIEQRVRVGRTELRVFLHDTKPMINNALEQRVWVR